MVTRKTVVFTCFIYSVTIPYCR